MPIQTFPHPFNLPLQSIVPVSGDLTIRFGPPYNQIWTVEQITLKMLTAPVGATAEIHYMSAFVDVAPSARRASAAESPPIVLQGGETASVVWENCTPGDIGEVLVIYRKDTY